MDEKLKELITKMRVDKGWDKTDTPSILAKSTVIEAAELLECFQFDEDNFNLEDVKGELADVLMYALSLAMDLNLDVYEIIEEKIKDVDKRYPDAR